MGLRVHSVDAAAATAPFARRGRFNDVDEIGRAACTKRGPHKDMTEDCSYAKRVTQFSLIAIVGSPLLLSDDMSNWTKPWSQDACPTDAPCTDLVSLYGNEEVLAVHQALDADSELTYLRLAGGPITEGGVMPSTGLECNSSDPKQIWHMNTHGRLYSGSPGMEGWCLRQGSIGDPKPNAHSCGHAEYVWVSPCNTSCCGKNCEEYQWKSDGGTLSSALPAASDVPGQTLTVNPEGVPDTTMVEERFKSTDPRAPTQQVALGSDGLLRWGGAKGERCLATEPASSSSVFGRRLADGWAVLLINWAEKHATVSCDAECMGKMGFGGESVAVRDLWTHTDNGTATSLAFTVPGDGSVMLKLSKA